MITGLRPMRSLARPHARLAMKNTSEDIEMIAPIITSPKPISRPSGGSIASTML